MKCFNQCAFFLVLIFTVTKAYCIEAFVQPVIFYTPSYQPFAEIRIFVSNNGFTKILSEDSTYIYRAVITLVLRRGETILNAERIVLSSPSGKVPGPLIHQLRWPIDGGSCELETKIEDEQNNNNELTLINKLDPHKPEVLFLSDIQLSTLAKTSSDTNQILYKNGFYSEPLVYNHYNKGQNILYAYFESYTSQLSDEALFIKFKLSRKDSTGNFVVKQEWFKKRDPQQVDPYLLKHDISSMITGAYKLTVQILNNKSNILCERSVEFTRDNPFWDKIDEWARTKKEDKLFFDTLSEDSVDYSIRSMYPIISSLDASVINGLFRQKKMEEKRIFLFAYWSEISESLRQDARSVYKTHMQLARKLDKMFYSGFGYGFETDRGVIYLKYGNPDEIISEDKDNGAFPYEIWKYNKIEKTGQTNVKFLFYNPDLAGSDFRLLHSTAHGERQNKRWEVELYKNAASEAKSNNPIDEVEMQPNFNRRAKEYFKY